MTIITVMLLCLNSSNATAVINNTALAVSENDRLDRAYNFIIPPVDITCVNVELNGDVTLNWSPSTLGAGTFDSYEVYCVELGAAPIAILNNINIATYTHVGANAQIGQKHYYIITKSLCNGVLK